MILLWNLRDPDKCLILIQVNGIVWGTEEGIEFLRNLAVYERNVPVKEDVHTEIIELPYRARLKIVAAP